MLFQRYHLLAAAMALVAAAGCTGWRPHGTEGTPVPAGLHGDLRVTRKDNSVVFLKSAAVVNDSIVGSDERTNARVAIATDDVRMVERREISNVKTGGVAAIGAIVLLLGLALLLAGGVPAY